LGLKLRAKFVAYNRVRSKKAIARPLSRRLNWQTVMMAFTPFVLDTRREIRPAF
jgi:hypothetical protein